MEAGRVACIVAVVPRVSSLASAIGIKECRAEEHRQVSHITKE